MTSRSILFMGVRGGRGRGGLWRCRIEEIEQLIRALQIEAITMTFYDLEPLCRKAALHCGIADCGRTDTKVFRQHLTPDCVAYL